MKIADECYHCLGRLVRQAAELATEDSLLRARAIQQGLDFLSREFAPEKTSIAVATPLHRIVREVTGNPDPYLSMKQAEVAMAERLYRLWDRGPGSSLRDDILMAVRGNTIDFFKDFEEIRREMELPVNFAIDDTRFLESKLNEASRVLYLADNAGEVFFDLPLVRRLGGLGSVTYVVKESPVQNDISLTDLEYFGLMARLPRVITTGTDTPGVDMELASAEFRAEYEGADLVLAKGMGYWETLSELPAEGKVLHLLKAKCVPVAASLGVSLGSYVGVMR